MIATYWCTKVNVALFIFLQTKYSEKENGQYTEGCMGEQASLEFDLTFGDVLLPKLVQAY